MSRRSGAPGECWAGLVGGSAATSGAVCDEGVHLVLVSRRLGQEVGIALERPWRGSEAKVQRLFRACRGCT